MPSSKKPRAKKLLRPASDASCTLARTVERSGLRLGVWSCSSPSPGEPLDEPPRVTIAPVIERIGRRNWRFWFVSREEAERDEGEGWGCGPRWWFKAENANPQWVNNDPLGPYKTLKDAIEDTVAGVAAGAGS